MCLPFVTSRSVHSWAFRALNVSEDNALFSQADSDLENSIKSVCGENVLNFLQDMPVGTQSDEQSKQRAEKTVRNYISKTLTKVFLHSAKSEEEGFDLNERFNVYYPAMKWHQGKDLINPVPKGVPTASSKNDEYRVIRFYVENAKLIWDRMTVQDNGSPPLIMTFDSVLKRAQLQNTKIPCTALLVDESQDLNACQIAWICMQV